MDLPRIHWDRRIVVCERVARCMMWFEWRWNSSFFEGKKWWGLTNEKRRRSRIDASERSKSNRDKSSRRKRKKREGRNVGRFVREIAIHETLVAVSRMLVTLSFLFFWNNTGIYRYILGLKRNARVHSFQLRYRDVVIRSTPTSYASVSFQVKRIDDESFFSRARLLDLSWSRCVSLR